MRDVCHINLSRGYRGGERQTELLIRVLAGFGFDQRLVTRRDSALMERLRGVPGLRIDNFSWLPQLRLDELRSELFHAHEGRSLHLAQLAARLHGVPYIYTRRSDGQPKRRGWTLHCYRRAARIVALSSAIEEALRGYDPAIRVERIPDAHSSLPCDPAQVRRLRATWQGRFVVGQVGALRHSHKGQGHLIEAARLLAKRRPDVLFVFLGDGPDREILKHQAQGLENVVFQGFVDKVGDYLSAFDLCAYPSLHEGLGSVLLDAMYFGVPVVASGIDGIPDIVCHKQTGLLVPPGQPRALANAIERLYRDDGLRRRLADAGRVQAGRFSPDIMAHRYVRLYREIAPAVVPDVEPLTGFNANHATVARMDLHP